MEKSVNTTRPVHLNLFRMKFPPMAILSILHRVSGVVLFLLLPLALYLLHHSLQSQSSFSQLHAFVAKPIIRLLLWALVSAAGLHLFAGIRHMIMDCGFGEKLETGRITSYVVLILAVIVIVAVGVWLW